MALATIVQATVPETQNLTSAFLAKRPRLWWHGA